MKSVMNYPLLVFVISFFMLWLSAWIGASLLKRKGALDDEARDDFGTILAATLTLLGLIIGFSFSMAIGRYDQRKNYEEAVGQRDRHRICPGRSVARRRCGESARIASELPRPACLVLPDHRSGTASADQCSNRQVAVRAVVRGSGSGGCTADTDCRLGGRGHERRIEFAGLHSGCLVGTESHFRLGA